MKRDLYLQHTQLSYCSVRAKLQSKESSTFCQDTEWEELTDTNRWVFRSKELIPNSRSQDRGVSHQHQQEEGEGGRGWERAERGEERQREGKKGEEKRREREPTPHQWGSASPASGFSTTSNSSPTSLITPEIPLRLRPCFTSITITT